jgi:hypothetical protein
MKAQWIFRKLSAKKIESVNETGGNHPTSFFILHQG